MVGVPRRANDDDLRKVVNLLGDPIRARPAYWQLIGCNADALPAVRDGLREANPDVRMWCTKLLDHLVDQDALGDLVAMLDDPDDRVRADALHALACERCKDNECQPDKAAVLPKAIALLDGDPSPHVRAVACGLVGRWVHTDEIACAALLRAHADDPAPAVRKKAGWYAPGGTIHRKTMPRP
jgi:HEAT repeat protein